MYEYKKDLSIDDKIKFYSKNKQNKNNIKKDYLNSHNALYF